jgi:hypothetical protein
MNAKLHQTQNNATEASGCKRYATTSATTTSGWNRYAPHRNSTTLSG